jgi:hypothetical protein
MNWDAIGSIAEVVGALAVLITLAYLAVQVRQNNTQLREASRLTQIASLDHTVEMFSRFRGMLTESNNSELYVRGLESYASLSDAEKVQFGALIEEYIFGYHAMYARYINGHLDESTWNRRVSIPATLLKTVGGSEWWEARKAIFPIDFVQVMEN